MGTLQNKRNVIADLHICTALILLTTGLVFGLLGSFQYIIPGLFRHGFSFEKTRPLHVSSVIFWILLASMGSVMTYAQQHSGRYIRSSRLHRIQYILMTISILMILASYLAGIFGGREYWEYPPVLSIPIAASWILFSVLIIQNLRSLKKQPVYVWMWLTGLLFFLFTFIESNLWLIPWFSNQVVNDMTIQWKSYGSMAGSWNMLIYGCSIYLIGKTRDDHRSSHSTMAFTLYFIGLFNLMFNWGHHIYTLPTHNYIKYISYTVSMSEWILLARIIRDWRRSLTTAQQLFHQAGYRFMAAAEVWIFLNLLLALLMSVPVINVYTHGTHITVAHAMGSTIGINSMLLMAFIHDMIDCSNRQVLLKAGYWTTNIALLIFWISLIVAGIIKAQWQMGDRIVPFSTMMKGLWPIFLLFATGGFFLVAGFMMLIVPLIGKMMRLMSRQRNPVGV